MNPIHQKPTGPIFTYQAIPFPLPPEIQMELRNLSQSIQIARGNHQKSLALKSQRAFDRTKKAFIEADKALADYTGKIRKSIGIEFSRREFLQSGGRSTSE